MMKRIVRILVSGLVIAGMAGGIAASAALAQNEPTVAGYSNVRLWVNPEYDDPSLLVMMQGTIQGATPPATVQFLVPTAAVMYSAGSIDINGQYSGGPPDRAASQVPGFDLISYTVTSNTFRVEYYDDVIQGSPDKTVDFQFMSYLPIDGLNVSVQQPLKATNFTVEPAGTAGQDQEGFNIQTYSYGTINPLDSLSWHLSYYKADNAPSVQQNAGAGPSGGTGSGGLSNGALAAIIIVVVVVGGLVVYFMMQRNRPATRADRRRRAAGGGRRAPAATSRSAGGGGKAAGNRFCTNCGAQVSDSAKFCPECGTPRR